MIKLTKEIIDNLTFLDFVNIEKKHITESIETQENFKKKLLLHLKLFVNSINSDSSQEDENNKVDCLDNISKILKISNYNISSLNILINNLDEICNEHCLEKDVDLKILDNKLEDYNKLYTATFSDVSINNNSIQFFINKNCVNNDEENNLGDIKELELASQSLNIDYPEKTLIISEIDNKVLLPYQNTEIISILRNPNLDFKNEQEIIDKYYTLPHTKYKASSISRFKEAYKLVREKEKGSIIQALELSIELFSNYNLHPAVITACKNLNELDVYLSCLEYNELDDFNFFKTEFKISPYTTKNNL